MELQDDKTIVRYLLGELPEAEQVQLEERAFSDSDYLLQVRSVEKDLIDEYVRGELSGEEKDAFELQFFASEGRQRQIQFARGFGQGINEVSLDKRPAVTKSWWRFFSRRPNLALSFSLAAVAMIVVIGGVWFVRRSTQSEREQAQVPPTPQATAVVQEKATPGGDQQAQNEAQPTPSPAKLSEIEQTQRPTIASLILLPGTSRGADNRPQLTIATGSTSAQLRVVLDSGDDYKEYAVELRTIAGKVIRRQSGLTAHTAPGGRAVMLALPANLLAAGDYELTLNGLTEQKLAEPLGYYYFRVRKE